jgi:hypothetical protein
VQHQSTVLRIEGFGVAAYPGHVVGEGPRLREIVTGGFADKFWAIGVVEKHVPRPEQPFIAMNFVLWNELQVAKVNPPFLRNVHGAKVWDALSIMVV